MKCLKFFSILIATVTMNKHENLYHLFLYHMIFFKYKQIIYSNIFLINGFYFIINSSTILMAYYILV